MPGDRGTGVAFLLVTFLDSAHPALRPSGRLRRSRRSCGAVATQRKVTRSPGGERNKARMPHTYEATPDKHRHPSRARRTRANGTPVPRRRCVGKTRRVGHRTWPSPLSAQDAPSADPRSTFAQSQGRMPGDRGTGVAFLLVTFLDSAHPALRPSGRLRRSRRSYGAVGTQREVTRSPGGERKTGRDAAHRRSNNRPNIKPTSPFAPLLRRVVTQKKCPTRPEASGNKPGMRLTQEANRPTIESPITPAA
jgi:hypothetical protein